MEILGEIFKVIKDRRVNPKAGSYVSSLFEKGENTILEKVGEEATELIIASKEDSRDEIVYEASDLIFHVMVLLGYKGIELDDVSKELTKRKRTG